MKNIFLIGYRCSGKTFVGDFLGKLIGWPFVDTDIVLEEESGQKIRNIVESQGWNDFRHKERNLMKRVCAGEQQVVATGGGVVLNPENVKDMQKNGVVVWLRASAQTIKERMIDDENTEAQRPPLTTKGVIEEIEGVLVKRGPLYENASDFSIETDDLRIDAISRMIIAEIKSMAVKSEKIFEFL